MKKLLTLLLAAGMVVSAASGASAVEMKVSGSWLTSFTFADNLFGKNALTKDADEGTFNAAHRVRVNFDMVASESLSGRVQLEVANLSKTEHSDGQYYTWGTRGTGGNGSILTARLAYLDWVLPTTDVLVRMGRQSFTVPSYTFGSPVFDSVIDGVVVNAPVNDMIGVSFGWLRPFATVNKWNTEHFAHSSVDLAYIGVDVAGDGFKITPWGMIGLHGNGAVADTVEWNSSTGQYETKQNAVPAMDMMGGASADSRTTVYWVGLGGELTMFDPFKFTADFIYSANDADGAAGRKGWYAALGAEMKAGFATPFVKGWYASGDDADSEDSGRLMSINGGGAFDASSTYFDANGLLAASIDNCNPAGTWGVQAGVKGVSFVEDLTHALSVTYFQGTNNTQRVVDLYPPAVGTLTEPVGPAGYMTTSDSAWSIDFLSSYKLYQNLTANLLLAYLVTDFDEKVWGDLKFDNAFRGTLNFTYAV